MTDASSATLRALARTSEWDALRARLSALSVRKDLGIASELDLAELEATRITLDQLIESLR